MRAPTDEIFIETRKDAYRAVALAQGALRDVASEPFDRRLAVGTVHVARVARLVPQLGAILDLEGGARALMDVPGRAPEQGALLRVQIVEPSFGEKLAKASRTLALAGRFCVLTPGGKGAAISKRLVGPKREALGEMAARLVLEGEGLNLRLAAAYVASERVAAELAKLRAIASSLAGELGSTPRMLLADDPFAALLRTLAPQDTPAIFCDTPEALRAAREGLAELFADVAGFVARVADPKLFERHGVGDILASAEATRVDLAGGAWLSVEPTAALVAIDVNQGNSRQSSVEINLAAAREIGRQLRLRDLGGLVAVDFLRMAKPGERTRTLEAAKHATQSDRRRVDVLGFTPGGVVEMTRARARGGLVD
jgi:Rne/Rng family ribonuclease